MIDDLEHLKTALQHATPEADAQRKDANLAHAQSNFVRMHVPTVEKTTIWQRGKNWIGAGLVSLTTATAAVVLLVPDAVDLPTESAVSEIAEFADAVDDASAVQLRAAPAAITTHAVVAETAPEMMDVTSSPIDGLRSALESGALPPASSINVQSFLASALAGYAFDDSAIDVLAQAPWDGGIVLRILRARNPIPKAEDRLIAQGQTGNLNLALYDSPNAPVDEDMNDETRLILGVFGFTLLLAEDPRVSGWSYDAAVDLAEAGASAAIDHANFLSLMRAARDIAAP